jgi:hypothetical protein
MTGSKWRAFSIRCRTFPRGSRCSDRRTPGAATRPTWAEQVASFCPVRELTPGDRPRDWVAGDELPAPATPARPEEAVEVKEPLRFKV